ncbi:MAG: IS5 family transposase [Kosmotogaceae bacterium]
MQRASLNKIEWKRHKEVSVSWAIYDAHRLNECKRILDLRDLFDELDKPVHRREFKLSQLTVLLLLKLMFGISYRTIASATKDLKLYQLLGMKRAPCYKTIQNTMQYLTESALIHINQRLTPKTTHLGGLDSSGMKTHHKGAWVVIRFHRNQQRRDFKKVHLFVDLVSKKILHCLVTTGRASDAKQVKKLLRGCNWIRVDVILGDRGYDTRECFHEITSFGALPGIPVRRNATTKSRGCPSRRKAVLAQQRDYEQWKQQMQYTMRCVVESIFSGLKRRFGEHLFSIKERFRTVEMWLKTILWNVLIYPR